ncbi:hypothetical protein CEXT_602411 [Caerostris extrusa]|uniref:Uncharacterized protein n=1 Tax=Caerostris extrusa TaxID=172846 RepID=A0AAV4XJH9_CAEEX|nr:hypothetical protein CEXT_602411 [Caerostris extrusa]
MGRELACPSLCGVFDTRKEGPFGIILIRWEIFENNSTHRSNQTALLTSRLFYVKVATSINIARALEPELLTWYWPHESSNHCIDIEMGLYIKRFQIKFPPTYEHCLRLVLHYKALHHIKGARYNAEVGDMRSRDASRWGKKGTDAP